MKFHAAAAYPKNLDAIIVRVAADQKALWPVTKQIDTQLKGVLSRELRRRRFKGGIGEGFIISTSRADYTHVIVVGAGKAPFDAEQSRRSMAAAIKLARQEHLTTLATHMGATRVRELHAAQAVVEAALLTDYRFNWYQQSSKRPELRLTLVSDQKVLPDIRKQIARAQNIAAAVVAARDLVNEPPSTLTPKELAARARKLLTGSGVRLTVMDERQIKRLKMEGILAVAAGSDQPPRLLKMQYSPRKVRGQKHIVLIGKGITFDSGGINLKPSRGGSLEDMKMDMAGGAAVITAMSALKALGVKHKVTGYVAATENLTGGSAYKPGDVIRSFNGKTIEVLNTDAEGRLTLADVMGYSEKNDKPDVMIDLATLTATEVSLGLDYAALFGTDDQLKDDLQAAGESTGEKVWPFPLPEDYQETVKGRIAELRNTGTDRGYSINGAVFLRNFVTKTPWSHIDIGSPAMSDRDRHYHTAGGTGFGTRLLLEYLSR